MYRLGCLENNNIFTHADSKMVSRRFWVQTQWGMQDMRVGRGSINENLHAKIPQQIYYMFFVSSDIVIFL
jgi:hypothetical protein